MGGLVRGLQEALGTDEGQRKTPPWSMIPLDSNEAFISQERGDGILCVWGVHVGACGQQCPPSTPHEDCETASDIKECTGIQLI